MQESPWQLRLAVASDAVAVAACVHAAYRHYVARIGTLPRPLRDDNPPGNATRDVRLAVSGDEILGVLVLAEDAEGFLLENIAVAPSVKGQGLGRVLLELAEAEARRRGFGAIYLYTHEGMTENQALYAKIGYAEYDRRMDDGLARVFMRKRLA